MVTIFSSQEEKNDLQEAQENSSNHEPVENGKLNHPPDNHVVNNFSAPAWKLVQTYLDYYLKEQTGPEVATLHVDEIASKVALFYEKIRKIVDWKEEHLVRRGAIERILKRKMMSELSGISIVTGFHPERIAEPLVLELIRGGHLPNDKIPQARVENVAKTLKKYTYILQKNPLAKTEDLAPKVKKRINLYNWIIEVAACEIEEILAPPIKEKALIACMVGLMDERIRVMPEQAMSDEEKNRLLYIAVHRTLFHLDAPIISYHLLKRLWPGWDNFTEEQLGEIAQNIFTIWEELEKDLNHPHSSKFFSICEKYDTLYTIFSDVLEKFAEKPEEMISSITQPEDLKSLLIKAYDKRLSTLKKRLVRAAIYSTLSIFVSSAASLYIIEVPLAKFFYGRFSFSAIAVDIGVPTALMAFLVAIVKPPRETNRERVIKETNKVIYKTKELDVYEIKIRKKRGTIMSFVIGFFYLLGTAVSLILVYLVFNLAKIPVTSLYIDTLNVAMIAFAALVIRQRAKELTVEEKASFWEFSIDILSVPMARLGQWLAAKWKEYNIVSVFFIALVDMPFSTFIQFIENWSSFLKEKKAEITQ